VSFPPTEVLNSKSVYRFEDAIQHVMNGGRSRRKCWAKVPEYTRATPPISYNRMWRIWFSKDAAAIMQGWGGQIGFARAADDPVNDGTYYVASDEDRIATDWELLK
jgi:hypothetical protein